MLNELCGEILWLTQKPSVDSCSYCLNVVNYSIPALLNTSQATFKSIIIRDVILSCACIQHRHISNTFFSKLWNPLKKFLLISFYYFVFFILNPNGLFELNCWKPNCSGPYISRKHSVSLRLYCKFQCKLQYKCKQHMPKL